LKILQNGGILRCASGIVRFEVAALRCILPKLFHFIITYIPSGRQPLPPIFAPKKRNRRKTAAARRSCMPRLCRVLCFECRIIAWVSVTGCLLPPRLVPLSCAPSRHRIIACFPLRAVCCRRRGRIAVLFRTAEKCRITVLLRPQMFYRRPLSGRGRRARRIFCPGRLWGRRCPAFPVRDKRGADAL